MAASARPEGGLPRVSKPNDDRHFLPDRLAALRDARMVLGRRSIGCGGRRREEARLAATRRCRAGSDRARRRRSELEHRGLGNATSERSERRTHAFATPRDSAGLFRVHVGAPGGRDDGVGALRGRHGFLERQVEVNVEWNGFHPKTKSLNIVLRRGGAAEPVACPPPATDMRLAARGVRANIHYDDVPTGPLRSSARSAFPCHGATSFAECAPSHRA